MMQCQRCRQALPEGSLFCDRCGTQQLARVEAGAGRRTLPPAVPAVTPSLQGSAPKVQLLLRDGTVFDLPEGEFLIGRRDQSNPGHVPEIDLTEWSGASQGVSRQHAGVTVASDGVYIEDLGSANLTLLNGYRLMKGQRYLLANGDELRVGLVTLWVVIKPA